MQTRNSEPSVPTFISTEQTITNTLTIHTMDSVSEAKVSISNENSNQTNSSTTKQITANLNAHRKIREAEYDRWEYTKASLTPIKMLEDMDDVVCIAGTFCGCLPLICCVGATAISLTALPFGFFIDGGRAIKNSCCNDEEKGLAPTPQVMP